MRNPLILYLLFQGIFFLIIFIVYFFISSGDFSFFLTLSGFVQLFGFSVILTKIYQTRTVSGLSKNTIILYMILLFFRSLSCLIFEGLAKFFNFYAFIYLYSMKLLKIRYIPLDRTGDWFYQIVEISSFVIAAGNLKKKFVLD